MRVAFNLGQGIARRTRGVAAGGEDAVRGRGRPPRRGGRRARLPAVVGRARARDERDLGRRHVARTPRRRPRDARRHRAARRRPRARSVAQRAVPRDAAPLSRDGIRARRHDDAARRRARRPSARPGGTADGRGVPARAGSRRRARVLPRVGVAPSGSDRLGRGGLVAVAGPGAMVQRGPAPRGGRARCLGGRGVRVVHVRLGPRRAARVRVRDQLPPPRGDVGRGVGVVALVPPRVPRSRTDAQVHRSPGASAGAARGGAAGAARVVVPVDAAAARRSGGARGPRVPAGVGGVRALGRGRAVPGEPGAVAGGGAGRGGLGRAALRAWGGCARSRSARSRRSTAGRCRRRTRWRSGSWIRRRRRRWLGCSAARRPGCTTSSDARRFPSRPRATDLRIGRVRNEGQPAITRSAIWIAFSAAPLRRLSPQANSRSSSSWPSGWRIRPTSTSSIPAASSGLG